MLIKIKVMVCLLADVSVGPLRSRRLPEASAVGTMLGKPLIIEGRNIRHGEILAVPGRNEVGVAGLLPTSLFKTVYICNSEGYVVFD